MGRLSLMVLSLAVLLFAANSLPPVEEELPNIVSEILNRYRPTYEVEVIRYRPTYEVEVKRKRPMFSLVVSIPLNTNTDRFDISLVPDDANNVRNTIIGCEVYTGDNILAATVLRWPDVKDQCPNGCVQWEMPQGRYARTWAEAYQQDPLSFREGTADHAEYRTLQELPTLLRNDNIRQNLLLIYVYASPCASRCTNRNNAANILNLLEGYSKLNIVFVFSKVFMPRPRNTDITPRVIPPQVLQRALRNLGGTIGLQRIFRCDEVNDIMRCVNCNNNGNVAGWCYDNNLANEAGGTQ